MRYTMKAFLRRNIKPIFWAVLILWAVLYINFPKTMTVITIVEYACVFYFGRKRNKKRGC